MKQNHTLRRTRRKEEDNIQKIIIKEIIDEKIY